MCATPGCTLADFHTGPCNNTSIVAGSKRKVAQPHRHEPEDFKMHKPNNKFQLSDESLRVLILNNIGVVLRTHTKFLSGEWKNPEGKLYEFDATIIGVRDSIDKATANDGEFCGFVVLARCEDGLTCKFTPELLMNVDTRVTWNPATPDFLAKHTHEITSDRENAESMKRAGEFAFLYVQACGADPEDFIVTLDGNGENRLGMQARFEAMGIPKDKWPRILTIEMDPKVALNQRLAFGNDVFYSKGDSEFIGTRISKGKTLLEDLLANKNRIITDEMKLRVKAVYFDYCGGPPDSSHPKKCRQNFAMKIFPQIRNMKVFGMTMSYRQHFKLGDTFEQYIAIPPNFSNVETFLNNRHVICKMYVKNAIGSPPNEPQAEKQVKPRTCSICNAFGHTKRKCPLRPAPAPEAESSAEPVVPLLNAEDVNEASNAAAVAHSVADTTVSVVNTEVATATATTTTSNEECPGHAALLKLKGLLSDKLIPQSIYESKVSEILTKMGL